MAHIHQMLGIPVVIGNDPAFPDPGFAAVALEKFHFLVPPSLFKTDNGGTTRIPALPPVLATRAFLPVSRERKAPTSRPSPPFTYRSGR